MLTIFLFSSQSSSELPNFDWADRIVKKGGHMIGYALLALSCWQGFEFKHEKRWLAWCLVILYALSDEFHQSFVPGRFPSVMDVLVFDNLGALIGLWFSNLYKTQRSDSLGPIVEKVKARS